MLAKCSNPACAAQFRYLHQGKLFYIEYNRPTPALGPARDFASAETPRDYEYFWLCPACAVEMTVQFDGHHGVVVRRLASPDARPAPNHLRLRDSWPWPRHRRRSARTT